MRNVAFRGASKLTTVSPEIVVAVVVLLDVLSSSSLQRSSSSSSFVSAQQQDVKTRVGFASCTLCPDGASPKYPDRTYQLGKSSITCRQFAADIVSSTVESFDDGEEGASEEGACWGTISWGNTFDWQSFCGCPELEEPKNVCGDFCFGGKVDAGAKLPSEIAVGQSATCGNFAALYPYLLDNTQCGADRLKSTCCVNFERSSAFGSPATRSIRLESFPVSCITIITIVLSAYAMVRNITLGVEK